jgi:hypothetical protein
MTSRLRRKRPITARLQATISSLSGRPLRRMSKAACVAALLAAQVSGPQLSWAREEAFKPVPSGSATAIVSDSSLQWRARGSKAAPVKPVSATAERAATQQVEPAVLKTAEPARTSSKLVTASRFSSKQTRSRLRDSVMQVNSYQDPEAPPFGDEPAAEPATPNELPDPLDSQNEAPAPPEGAPPAMPNDPAPPLPGEGAIETQPQPVDELFRDEPIPEPRQPAELTAPERQQLLDQGLSTDPGGPGCVNQKDECQRAIQDLQKRDITTITVGLLIEGEEGTDFPCDCLIGRDFNAPKFAGRDFAPTLFTWKASGTCHKPLYFEDVQLERYGHSWNPIIQPFASGAHFFVSVPLLPYKMGLRPPNECVYTLGYYRPGNCAPYMLEPIPLSLRAAVFQGVGTAAFAFWFWPPN